MARPVAEAEAPEAPCEVRRRLAVTSPGFGVIARAAAEAAAQTPALEDKW